MDPLNRQSYTGLQRPKRQKNSRLFLLLMIALVVFVGSRGFGPAMLVLPALVMMPWMFGESIVSVMALVVITLVMGAEGMIFWLILNGGMMLWMGMTMRRGQKNTVVYWGGVVLALVGLVLLLVLANGGLDLDMQQIMTDVLALQKENMETAGLSQQDIALTMDVLQAGARTMMVYMPTVLILYGLLMPYLIQQMAGRVVKSGNRMMTYSRPFILFRLPSSLPWGVVLIFVAMLFLRNTMGDAANAVIYNLVAIFSAIFLLNGMAVFQFYLAKRDMRRGLRIFLGLLTVIIPITGGILLIVGVVDAWFNLRKI